MSERKEVRILGSNKVTRFNMLFDDGTDRLEFGTRAGGYIIREDSIERGETIVDGWLTLAQMDLIRDNFKALAMGTMTEAEALGTVDDAS